MYILFSYLEPFNFDYLNSQFKKKCMYTIVYAQKVNIFFRKQQSI